MNAREALAALANEAARTSRRSGAPLLSAESSREVVLDWLQWNDANGCFTDERAAVEDFDPMTLDEAWSLVFEALGVTEAETYAQSHVL